MRNPKDNLSILIIGLIISIASLALAFSKINHWYFLGVFGFWFVFDYFSSIKNNNTGIQIFIKSKKKFLKLYFLMFMLGCAIEIIGRFVFNLWIYPLYSNPLFDITNLLIYPFILMSFRESYETLKIIFNKKSLSFIGAMILGILIWEIPNLVSRDWLYTIPFISLEIIGINIIVIIGWAILIGFPIWIFNNFFGGNLK